MRVKKSDLLSLKEGFATYMTVMKANLPKEMKREISRKLLLLTDFELAQAKVNRLKTEGIDVVRAKEVQFLQDNFGPMSANEAIDMARSLHGWSEQILSFGWLSEKDTKALKENLKRQNSLKEAFPLNNELKHSVSRGKKQLRDRN